MQVARNDQITIQDIESLNPSHLVISPGPCTPDEAGISCEAIRHFAGKIPILGVCLGASGDWSGLWRAGCACEKTCAWQGACDQPLRCWRVLWSTPTFGCDTVSLLDCRA